MRHEKLLTIYILAGRDNLDYLKQSVDSAVASCSDEVQVVLSCNNRSLECQLEGLIKGTEDKPEVRVRGKQLPSHIHLETCARECKTPYVMFFHDDDVLIRGYVEFCLRIIKEKRPELIMSNAEFDSRDVLSTSEEKVNRRIVTLSRVEMARKMLRGESVNFASCIYRADNVRSQDLEANQMKFGKFGDRPLMLESVKECDEIVYVKGNSVRVRVHDSQDSHRKDPDELRVAKNLLRYYAGLLRNSTKRWEGLWIYAAERSVGRLTSSNDLKRFVNEVTTAGGSDAVSLLSYVWLKSVDAAKDLARFTLRFVR